MTFDNDIEEVFIFQNSYGDNWHYNGFGKIHYSYIINITKAIAINKSCIKDNNSLNVKDDDYIFNMDNA